MPPAAADREKEAGRVLAASVQVAALAARVDGLRYVTRGSREADGAEIRRLPLPKEWTTTPRQSPPASGRRSSKPNSPPSADGSEGRQDASNIVAEQLPGRPGGRGCEGRGRRRAPGRGAARRPAFGRGSRPAGAAAIGRSGILAANVAVAGAGRTRGSPPAWPPATALFPPHDRNSRASACAAINRVATSGGRLRRPVREALPPVWRRARHQPVAALKDLLETFNNTLQQAQGALDEARKKVTGLARRDLAPLADARRGGRSAAPGGQELGRLLEQQRSLSDRFRELGRTGARRGGGRPPERGAAGDRGGGRRGNGTKMQVLDLRARGVLRRRDGSHQPRRLAVMSSGRYALSRATDTPGGATRGSTWRCSTPTRSRAAARRHALGRRGIPGLTRSRPRARRRGAVRGRRASSSSRCFIDEGFGSLDAESLELAQRCIVDLQRSGRPGGAHQSRGGDVVVDPRADHDQKTPRGSVIVP